MKGASFLILTSLVTTPALWARPFQASTSAEQQKKNESETALTGLQQGQTYLNQGNFAEAERHFKQSLGGLERALGPDDPNVAIALNSLATLYRIRENYEAAASFSRRSLEIVEKAYGMEHLNVAVGLNSLALIRRLQRDYDEAALLLRRSLSIFEKTLTADDPTIAAGLNNLVAVYRLQGNYAQAEPLARRSLAILQQQPRAETSTLAQSLENLAGICLALEKFEESEHLYLRVLSVRWGAGSNVAPILERFATILNLAYSDKPLQAALDAFRNTPGWDGVSLDLYILMGQKLLVSGLTEPAEDLLLRAIRAFPHSRRARYELAEIYANSRRSRAALERFLEAARLTEPVELSVDRNQRSLIHFGIARMDVNLAQFDEALSNFKTALELDPGNVEARVALGDLYLQLDRLDEAAAEYTQAIQLSGGHAAAYYGVAVVNRRLGRFPESLAAAEKALGFNSRDAKSSYVRAVALLRAGQREEGEAELVTFRKLEAEERDRRDRARDIRVVIQSAVDSFEDGKVEEAFEGLRSGTRSYPESGLFHLNLGILQSRLGRHRAAVDTFEAMIALGFGDNFLVHLNLSQEYETLGDTTGSRRHRLTYLQRYDDALRNRTR